MTQSQPTPDPTSESGGYDASSLTVLKGLDPVRKRPGMYIGSTDSRGLMHLIWEIVDNSVDEAAAGHCSEIRVIAHLDGSFEVQDNGRGIPVDVEKSSGKSGLELIFTELHAGGKFGGGGYGASGGLHGVGASVVNALSEKLVAEVDRHGYTHTIEFARGEPTMAVTKGVKASGTGTRVRWWPDAKIFDPAARIEMDTVRSRMRQICFLVPGLTVTFTHKGETETFHSEDGLVDFCEFLSHGEAVCPPIRLHGEGTYTESIPVLDADGALRTQDVERKMQVDVALRWVAGWDTTVKSFVNTIITPKGGSHVAGFERALTRVMNEAMREQKVLRDKDDNVLKEDVQEGLVAILRVTIIEPQFEGQTKEVLGTPAAQSIVYQVVSEGLREWFGHRAKKTDGRALLQKVNNAAKARIAARTQRETVRRKNAIESSSLPAKLADCRTHDLERSELILIEGDSAGGSAKAARDSEFQALLPLRGKILNVAKASMKQILENAEVGALIAALGAGFGKEFDSSQLRYGRLVLMCDADVDGAHIRVLILTLVYHFMRPMLEEGRVFAAMPPLFLVKVSGSKEQHYCYTDRERDEIVARIAAEGKKIREVQRYKGLGEMDAEQLADTTMDPTKRSLRRVSLDDADEAARMFDVLMGSAVEPRREFITTHAEDFDIEKLDI